MKIFLITGCAGLIGSNLVHWLLDNVRDVYVVGVDNLSGGYEKNLPTSPNFSFYKLDVESDEFSELFKMVQPEYVCHLAAYAAECLSPFIRKFNYTNNLVATANVVNNCVKYNVKRLLFTSSIAVYGEGNQNPPFDEELIPCPIDPYGVAKFACEQDIRIAGKQHNLDWVILRPHNVYGKYQAYNDRYRNVLGIWMFQHLNGRPLTVFGDGSQKRSFSYIDDCVECFYTALTSSMCSKQIINIGGIHEHTIRSAAELVLNTVQCSNSKIVHLERRHEVKYAYPTYQKSVKLLNFKHTTDLNIGISKMWQWVQSDYQDSKRTILSFDKYELDKDIYSYWKN